jgi:hypothetical protein
MTIDRFTVTVLGRPAPQGSKHQGQYGQMREASPYLPAWRAAVKLAVYERYRELGIEPAALPLFVGPVGVSVVFFLATGDRIDGPPDGDKLTRATWDALGRVPKIGARVIEDDSRIVEWVGAKRPALVLDDETHSGAQIEVWSVE